METAADEKKGNVEAVQDIFKGVTYYIVGEISSQVTCLLEKFGAKRDSYLSEMVSHVIADSVTSDDYSEAKELFELPIVTSDWVVLSIYCGVQLPLEAFALEGRLFCNVVAAPLELVKEDAEALWCMLTFHGGKCQLHLDDKVTHLITARMSGAKYTAAIEHAGTIKIVTPDWVVDSITKGEIQEEDVYHPKLIEIPKPPEPVTLPVTPAVAMETDDVPSDANAHLLVASSVKQQTLDDRQDVTRPDTPNAKEALARKITSRIHGKTLSEPSTPERPSYPSLNPAGSSGSGSGIKLASPIPTLGLQPRIETLNVRNTLRNITNRAGPPGNVQMRPTVPSSIAKLNPGMGMGITAQPRPPPPDYPFPLRVAAPPASTQQTQPSNITMSSSSTTSSTTTTTTTTSTTSPSQSGPSYFGHDPKDNVSSDFCLLGCVFCIVDYQNMLGLNEIAAWKTVIEQYGGQVEASYCHRVTHVLCSYQKSDVFKAALKEGKRVVSAFWLNDCLLQKKMIPPWQALHLPLSYNSEKPGFNQMISVTNFDGEERVRLKQMINAIGAKYTGYMTHHNSALICKKPGGMKFEKAKEWRIAVVNVQWLSDLVLGNMDALRLPVHVRYLQVGQGREFHMDLTRVSHLMGGWKSPVKITKDVWKKLGSNLMTPSGQENKCRNAPSPPKRQKIDCSSTAPEVSTVVPKVMFTLYPKSVTAKMEAVVKELGGVVVTNPRHCTHLVCPSIARTMKFFIAISTCRHIVVKKWLEDSADQGMFLGESNYMLKDEKGEKSLGCDLTETLRRAHSRPLFQGLTFYITPSTTPPVCELCSIIEGAGGTVLEKRPSAKHIAALMDDKGQPKFVVITCLNDLHLSQDLFSRTIPVFNAEFVLTGVLRQKVDFNTFRITVG